VVQVSLGKSKVYLKNSRGKSAGDMVQVVEYLFSPQPPKRKIEAIKNPRYCLEVNNSGRRKVKGEGEGWGQIWWKYFIQ
jgi:hypothetical protein